MLKTSLFFRNKSEEQNLSFDLSSGITKEDEKKISSLDLMMHYTHQRDEALWETNALIRSFLGQRKLQAASNTIAKVSISNENVRFAIVSNSALVNACTVS